MEVADIELVKRLRRNADDVEALQKAEELLMAEVEKWEGLALTESNLRNCYQAELKAQQDSIQQEISFVKDHIAVLKTKEQLASDIIQDLDARHNALLDDTDSSHQCILVFKKKSDDVTDQVTSLRLKVKRLAMSHSAGKEKMGQLRQKLWISDQAITAMGASRMLSDTDCDLFRGRVSNEIEAHLWSVPSASLLTDAITRCMIGFACQNLEKISLLMRPDEQALLTKLQKYCRGHVTRLRDRRERLDKVYTQIKRRLSVDHGIPYDSIWINLVGVSAVEKSLTTREVLHAFVEAWTSSAGMEFTQDIIFVVGDSLGICDLVVKTAKTPMQVLAFTGLSPTRHVEDSGVVTHFHVESSMKDPVLWRGSDLAICMQASLPEVVAFSKRDVPVVPVWKTGGGMVELLGHRERWAYPGYITSRQEAALEAQETSVEEIAGHLVALVRNTFLEKEAQRKKERKAQIQSEFQMLNNHPEDARHHSH